MKYDIVPTPPFSRELKRLTKKYPSLKGEIINLVSALTCNPKHGIALGNNCYKIRIAIKSKNTGKSGGARMITFFQVTDSTVFLVAIFNKSEAETITDRELKERLANLRF